MAGMFGAKRWQIPGFMPRDRPDIDATDMDRIGAIPAPETQQEAPKRGLFGGDFMGKMGTVGAILRDDPEAFAQIQQAQQQARNSDQTMRMAQQKREADWSDWQRQEQWKRDNPAAAEPTAIQRNYEWLRGQNPGFAEDYLKTQTQAPPIVVTNPDGTKTLYPAGAIPQAGGTSQGRPAIGAVMQDPRKRGGQAPRPFDVAPPQHLNGGAMTSGRRTIEGNRAVGGVVNSKHLTGEAADYAGPNLNSLLAETRKLPGLRRAFIHNNNHVHTEGDWNVPYFGKNGTRGR